MSGRATINYSKQAKIYRPYLLQYLSFREGNQYDRNYVFEGNELQELLLKATPDNITTWMQWKAYDGREDIDPDNDIVDKRSSTIEMCKKALSFYMPNHTAPWNTETQGGNPTRSRDVNEFIKFLKGREVKKQGQEPSAKFALKELEFRSALTILFSRQSFQLRYRIPTMMKLQYHLITRSDELGHFKTKDLRCHSDPRFRLFALEMNVYWSKNVMEERDCPEQILLGSMDSSYCLLLALAIYLEHWFTRHNGLQSVFLFSDDTDEAKSPDRTKANYASNLRSQVFTNPLFVSQTGAISGKLGSHSLRKYPATWASRNGCNADEINVRGRWKRQAKGPVDRYIDVKQQFTDAKVQAALCVGGPIKYKLVVGSGITDAWCRDHVVPGIVEYYGNDNSISTVLALPLLFACFHPELRSTVPDVVLNRITDAYSRVSCLPETVNPVQRILLNVYRINEILHIDEFIDSDNEDDNNNNNRRQTNNYREQNNRALNALLLQTTQLQQQLLTQYDNTATNINNLRSEVLDKLNVINNNLHRIAIQPPRMATPQQRHNNNEEAKREEEEEQLIRKMPTAVLSPHPRSLHELWIEYQIGIGGRKAAKFFTAHERGGKNKFKYCRRKHFWDLISVHVRAGVSSDVAIDRVYEVYGRRLSVSAILVLIRSDKPSGGHPNLQINANVQIP